jgi:hypothetical protein
MLGEGISIHGERIAEGGERLAEGGGRIAEGGNELAARGGGVAGNRHDALDAAYPSSLLGLPMVMGFVNSSELGSRMVWPSCVSLVYRKSMASTSPSMPLTAR